MKIITDKQEHLLVVAEELFASHGFEGVSVRMLAAKAGVNIAMISYYFGSKEQLFQSLVEWRSATLRVHLEDLMQDDLAPEVIIERLVNLYVNRIFTHPNFHRMIHRELSVQQRSKLNSVITDTLMKNFSLFKGILEKGQKKGYFRKVDTELTMISMMGTITQVTLSNHLFCKLTDVKEKSELYNDDKTKNRLIKHLVTLLKMHLLEPAQEIKKIKTNPPKRVNSK